MPSVRKIYIPAESQLHQGLDQAFYSDAFETDLRNASLSPIAIARRALSATPAWVDWLLYLRDRIAFVFGLKPAGRLKLTDVGYASGELAIGDTFSIFRVLFVDNDELVLGIEDSHLDVRISFLKRFNDQQATYVVSSWVKTHNALGRAYMLPVAPVHRLIVRVMMWGVPM